MEYRQLGGSGFKVPALTLGTGTFGGGTEFFKEWGASDVAEASRLIDICLENGLTMFDSADIYSNGLAEEILGQAIKGRRDQVLISTKGTFRMGDGPNNVGSSRWHLIRSVENSLKRLGTDYIDLYQTHWPDHGMQQEETLGALTDLIDQGKIRAWGSSNETCWGVMKNLWEAEKHGLARMATVQNNFSLINRRCESELAQVCRKEGVSLLPYSPLGGGVLCGKYNGGALPKGARFTDYIQNGGPRQKKMAARFVNERSLETTARLQVIAADLGVSVTALALAWSKQHDFVASTIVGATTVAQLNESLAAADLVLSAETLARISEIDEAIPCAMTEDGLRRL